MIEQARIYLDYNATAPLRPIAREKMMSALELIGNPSSVHAEGRAARALMEEAREQVARLVGARARDIVFTSSGTEAANLALSPAVESAGRAKPLSQLIASAGEHPCVLKGHRFPLAAVELAPLAADGRIDLDALEAAVSHADEGRVMLALQGANNETGVIQPVAEAAAIVRGRGGVVVCDAVQLAGRAPCRIERLGADFLILSGHKLGGPKGAGALVSAPGAPRIGAPLLRGGGQERGFRAGTENVAAIAGFGAAAAAASEEMDNEARRLQGLRDALLRHISAAAPDAIVFGGKAERLPNTLCFGVPGVPAETLLVGLDLAGVAVSSGAACSSGKVARSHVLSAMGVEPALAASAIRLSLGWRSTEEEMARFGDIFAHVLAPMRRNRSAAA
ncbi:MAG TPA: cysteine desulfurase family protein [Roseiarcus sp.]|nr:cysteine desulfurase family protein [Roseiarcus sp.]